MSMQPQGRRTSVGGDSVGWVIRRTNFVGVTRAERQDGGEGDLI